MARPVHCATRHGITPIVMAYHWTMRLWCQCWRKAKQPTRLFANMAPPRTRRICRPRMHQICLHPTMCATWKSHPMLTYGDTPCTRNSMVFYRQVPSRLTARPAPARRYLPVKDHRIPGAWSVAICQHGATFPRRTHCWV